MLPNEIPEYIVSDGISGGRSWGTYVRKPNGSLRRVHAYGAQGDRLPDRPTKLEALRDLYDYLWYYKATRSRNDVWSLLNYVKQSERVWAELQAEETKAGGTQ